MWCKISGDAGFCKSGCWMRLLPCDRSQNAVRRQGGDAKFPCLREAGGRRRGPRMKHGRNTDLEWKEHGSSRMVINPEGRVGQRVRGSAKFGVAILGSGEWMARRSRRSEGELCTKFNVFRHFPPRSQPLILGVGLPSVSGTQARFQRISEVMSIGGRFGLLAGVVLVSNRDVNSRGWGTDNGYRKVRRGECL